MYLATTRKCTCTNVEEGASALHEQLGRVGLVLAVGDVDAELGCPLDEAVTDVLGERLVLLELTQERPANIAVSINIGLRVRACRE